MGKHNQANMKNGKFYFYSKKDLKGIIFSRISIKYSEKIMYCLLFYIHVLAKKCPITGSELFAPEVHKVT